MTDQDNRIEITEGAKKRNLQATLDDRQLVVDARSLRSMLKRLRAEFPWCSDLSQISVKLLMGFLRDEGAAR